MKLLDSRLGPFFGSPTPMITPEASNWANTADLGLGFVVRPEGGEFVASGEPSADSCLRVHQNARTEGYLRDL